jgi:flagellar capping protein FliD
MVSKIGGIESDPLSLKSINFDKINEKRLKPYENRVKTIEDKIDFTTKQNEARSILKTKFDVFKNSIDNISLQTNAKAAYVMKSTEVASKGLSADDYFDVAVSSAAHIGDVEVRVQQLATRTSISLQKANGTGFAIGELFQNSALSIAIADVEPTINPIVVSNLAGLTINQVVDCINKALNTAGAKATAVLVPTLNGLYNIKVTSILTGSRTITLQPQIAGYMIFPNVNDNTIYDTVNNAIGKNAIVIINDQQVVTSHSNIITLGKDTAGLDIPDHIAQGVTLTLKKENSTLPVPLNTRPPYQTISIEQDKDVITDKISEFANAYNDLNEFITNQERRKASGIEYEEDAYLARPRELRYAKDLLYAVTDKINIDGLLKINSLVSIGIFKGQDGLLTIDSKRLNDSINTNFDEVVKFFKDDTKGFIATVSKKTDEILKLIREEALNVREKLLNEQQEFEKADGILRKEQKKIEEEMSKIEFINMQASMMQMYFQAMMQV